jgi:uncharacterized OB-fold protein
MTEPVQTTAGQERLRDKGIRPWPQADAVTRPFWEAAAEHRLVAPRCENCGRWQWPPEPACVHCGSTALRWVTLSGSGTVYSYIVDHRNMVPGFDGAYVVALVVPDEVEDNSVRLVTNIPGCAPEDISLGMAVVVAYSELRPGITLPQFVRKTTSNVAGARESGQ